MKHEGGFPLLCCASSLSHCCHHSKNRGKLHPWEGGGGVVVGDVGGRQFLLGGPYMYVALLWLLIEASLDNRGL